MNIASLVEAVSAGVGSTVIVGESMRRYWRRRETRQQQQFEAAVERIVDRKIADARRQIIAEIRGQRRR